MKTKIWAVLLALVVLAMPVSQARALGLDVSMNPEERLPSGKDTSISSESSLEVSAKSDDSTRVNIRAEIEAQIKAEGKAQTVKEAIEKRRALLEELKEKLLETGPQARANITAEINSARLEGLAEIKAMVKTPADIREFEKEKLEIGMELCTELTGQNESCQKEIKERQQKIQNLTDTEIERLRAIIKNSEEVRVKARLVSEIEANKKFKISIKEDASGNINFDVRAREISPEKAQELEKGVSGFDIENLKARAELSKQAFFKAKIKVDECGEKSTQECKEAKQNQLNEAKAFLINTLETIIAKLEKMKLTVEAESSVTVEESSLNIADLEKALVEIRQMKGDAEKSAESEIKNQIKKSNERLKELQTDIEKVSGFVQASRMGGILVKSAKLSEKLNRVLEKIALDKTDTSASVRIIAEFNSQLDLLRKDFESVQIKFKETGLVKAGDRKNILNEAQHLMDSFKQRLNTLHEKLQEILVELKKKNSLKHLQETRADAVMESQANAMLEAS